MDPLLQETDLTDRAPLFQQEHAKLSAAKTILVIGGGIVGVELAGEVVTKLPDKHVILLTSGPRLIADKPPAMGDRAKDFLERQGVEVRRPTPVYIFSSNLLFP
jgi:NADH dehydrogenase FAD-containing subunit